MNTTELNTWDEEVAPRGVTDPNDFPEIPDNLKRSLAPVESPSTSDGHDLCHAADPEEAADQFHLVKKVASTVPELDQSDAAVQAAERIALHLQGSNECIICAGEQVVDAGARFSGDRAAYCSFVAALVARNVLTKRDGELQNASSKLSKLHTIGEHADILRRKEVFPRLPQGYSALYAAVGLLAKLPGDENERFDRMVDILVEGERRQEISREFLIEQARKALPNRGRSGESRDQVTVKGAELILITPSANDIKKLEQEVTEDKMPACRRLGDLASDACDVVIVVPILALSTVKSRMIDDCGFRLERILLLTRPGEANITDAQVAVVAARGAGDHEVGSFLWNEEPGEFNALCLAESLFPRAVKKAHVFAAHAEGDWSALVGEDNWRTERE